ncbi:MAG: phage major tail protein, TP901-1 family [Anaerovoracaceae bacterium]
MKKMDLQIFAEAVQGKKLVYLYRILNKAATSDGAVMAFTTENGRTKSKDADSMATKDGSIRTPGVSEVEISATSILSKGDTMLDQLEAAHDNDQLVEIWEVNLAEEGTEENAGKFKAKYFQGYLIELEITSNAEEFTEVSLTFGINGNGVDGYATVTEQQQEIANYVFADTQKAGA